MQDRIVSTIVTLSEMLKDQTLALEESRQATSEAIDLSAKYVRERDEAREDLGYVQDRVRNLEADLRVEKDHSRRTQGYSYKADLFDAFMRNPDLMRDALNFLRSVPQERRGEKIALIKEVRSIAHLGLREAKDMVEAYLASHPVTTQEVSRAIVEKLAPAACGEPNCREPRCHQSAPFSGND
jgi:hypothetical protein